MVVVLFCLELITNSDDYVIDLNRSTSIPNLDDLGPTEFVIRNCGGQ